MDPKVQFVFFLAALICFTLEAFKFDRLKVALIALGLALFSVPFMWNAAVAGW